MPAPSRGTGVLQVGTVTAYYAATGACDVTVAGQSYYLNTIPSNPSGLVWVLFAGRAGIVLGEVAT